ncbi:MAG: LapA family protein [Spirochaetales bacterium]|nr:LapA family protein [Spirochaetales bacterium]
MVRLIIGALLGILVVVFALQNLDTVTYTFFAWSLDVSRGVVVIIVLAVGIFVGWFLTGLRRLRKKK